MHENYDYYMDCKYRNRNKGLFTADQVKRDLNEFRDISKCHTGMSMFCSEQHSLL